MYYMPKVAVYNIAGDQTGELELDDNVFNVEVLDAVLHQAVVMQQANQRQGNASTKTRGFVRGGGRKPWKQKGTGRARAGSTRSPIWVGGGITFGPHPRSYAFSMPKKARRLAIRGALTVKLQDAELVVIDAIDFAEPKTQNTLSLLKNLKSDKKTLIITAEQDDNVQKSSRNIPGVKTITSMGLNVVDLLYHDKVLVTKGAVAKIEEVLG
jgi:large subunit ribosomal protein L4